MQNNQSRPASPTAAQGPVNRRSFMRWGGAAAIATGGMLTARPALAAPGDGVAGATSIPRPAGLGPRAMIDARFPIAFAGIPRATEAMIGFFTGLNQRDAAQMAEYLHFPFASFEGIEPVAVESAVQFLADPPASMDLNTHPVRFTDRDGYIEDGSYDLLQSLEVIAFDPVNVVFAMTYDRCNRQGNRMLRCDGIYSVTNNDGRWAIQLMSTIFTPDDMIGLEYPDAIQAAVRSRIDHDLAYQIQDIRYDHPPQEGARASVRNTGGAPFWMAPEGKIMDNFRIQGVTSRLRVTGADDPRVGQVQSGVQAGGSGSVLTGDEGVEAYMQRYRELFPEAGLPEWGFVSGYDHNSRVIHASQAKVHIFGGASRYSTSGEFLNSNFDVRVVTYRNGFWGSAGSFIYMTPHDRSNDLLPPEGAQ